MNKLSYRWNGTRAVIPGLPWLLLMMAGPAECGDVERENPQSGQPVAAVEDEKCEEGGGVCETPRFGSNSPFSKPYSSPVPPTEKRIWAASWLWAEAPKLVVEKWLGPEPDRKGKFVLIEFWATWCRPCRLSIPKLNEFHRRFADDLVVIGITDEDEAAVRKMIEPRIEFPLAIDTKARMKDRLSVMGIPHAILIEPGGFVVWEGFPLLEGHELTAEKLAAYIKVGRAEETSAEPEE